MTSKGQVTVPKSLRDHLGLKPGAAVEFVLGPTGEVMVRAARPGKARRRRSGRFGSLRGTLRTGRTTDELMQLLRGYGEDAGDLGFA